MSDNSRQDDLLNRLKSCVGALTLESSTQSTIPKQNTSSFKENQLPYKQLPPFYPLTSTHKMQNLGSTGYERKPMSSLNNESWTTRNRYGADYVREKPKQQFVVKVKQTNYNNYLQQTKINEDLARFKSGLNTLRIKETEVTPQLDKYRTTENIKQNQVKNSIARRYSQMQNQKKLSSNVAESSYSNLKPNKTMEKSFEASKISINPKMTQNSKPPKYRQELQQRKNLMKQDYTFIAQKPLLSARKQLPPGNIRRENVGMSMQKQPILMSLNRPNFQSQQRQLSQIQPKLAKSNGRPQIQEFLKKSLQNQEGDCTALAKLKKISELNQKINERIRNIINVFQEQK